MERSVPLLRATSAVCRGLEGRGGLESAEYAEPVRIGDWEPCRMKAMKRLLSGPA